MSKNKYEEGKIVKGCVTGIENYGIFVGLDNYYSGLIHISEISDGFVRNVNDYVDIGETIRVKILSVDDENYHVKLSIKNINYRINGVKKYKIREVGSGFKCLEDNLNVWIKKKEEEIYQKKA